MVYRRERRIVVRADKNNGNKMFAHGFCADERGF